MAGRSPLLRKLAESIKRLSVGQVGTGLVMSDTANGVRLSEHPSSAFKAYSQIGTPIQPIMTDNDSTDRDRISIQPIRNDRANV